MKIRNQSENDMSEKELSIPYDVADRITLVCLKDQYAYLKSELADNYEKGSWIHPEDVGNNHRLMKCLEEIIKYYGGDVNE